MQRSGFLLTNNCISRLVFHLYSLSICFRYWLQGSTLAGNVRQLGEVAASVFRQLLLLLKIVLLPKLRTNVEQRTVCPNRSWYTTADCTSFSRHFAKLLVGCSTSWLTKKFVKERIMSCL